MVGTRSFRRQQQKHEIDRLAVERLKIDRPFEPRKKTKQVVELWQLAMGNGDAMADPGRAELLALLQNLQDSAFVLAAQLGCFGGKLVQDLLLAVDPQRRNDGV